MRLNPHVLGLIAGTLIGAVGCTSSAEVASNSTPRVAGSATSSEGAATSENGNGASETSGDVVTAESTETSDEASLVSTPQGGVAEEDYPAPCGRG